MEKSYCEICGFYDRNDGFCRRVDTLASAVKNCDRRITRITDGFDWDRGVVKPYNKIDWERIR